MLKTDLIAATVWARPAQLIGIVPRLPREDWHLLNERRRDLRDDA